MAYTFEQLHKMRVADLRKIAEGLSHPELEGYTTMHKEQLVPALCHALGIPDHVVHEVKGLDKTKVKKQIRQLKAERDEALQAKDYVRLKRIRTRIRKLKNALRRAALAAAK